MMIHGSGSRPLPISMPRHLRRVFWSENAGRLGKTTSSANISVFRRVVTPSPFTWEMYEQATRVHVPLVPPGRAFMPAEEPAAPITNPFRSLKTAGGVR